jgi:hypothetical protein
MKVSLTGRPWDNARQWVVSAFRRVIASDVVKVATESTYTPGDPIRFSHGLGEQPTAFFSCRKDDGFEVYIEDGDELGWTDKTMTVRCSAAGKKFTLLIVGSR